MSQVKIDFIVTGNMSSLHKQVQTLNAELMAVAGSMTAIDRSMSNVNLQAANAQFGRMLTTSGQFTQQMVTMKTSTDLFADSLSRQQLSMRQAFAESRRYIAGRQGLIRSLAKQQVMMQNSMVMPHGVGPTGKVTASVITPTGLDKNFATQMRVANKSWEVFNATAQQGATQMVNWGKNTQWAGRQLMVGFTVPLMIAGGLAAKTFKELDEELVRLQKVYGSGFSFGEDFKKQSEIIRESAMQMAKDMASAYGQAGTETAALMADLAATGFEGQDLMNMTRQTTKLATLGEVDRQEAMKATVALQSAFKMSTDEVADSVLFLNAVENQTSASLQDLVEAIPRAGTVIKGLGGSVEDLALYMTAMREGGISAAEGANALKSGLSSIIAPPQAAVEFMKEFGINLPQIVQQNAGDLTGTIMAFQKQLKGLDDLARQQVITKLFGKYQFARMSAFFENLGAQGSQTQKVLDLMGTSMEDLAKLADQEIGAQAESVSGKWKRAWEEFKVNLAVVGEDLLALGTKVVDVFNGIFGFLSDNEWLMKFIKYLGLAAAAIGPVIMLMGLFGNMIGMIVKGVLRLANGFKAMASGGGIARTFEMLTAESFQADSAVEQLTRSMYDQTTAQKVLTQGIQELKMAYQGLGQAAAGAATAPGRAATAVGPDANWVPMGAAGWSYGSVPMARAHFVPRSLHSTTDASGKVIQPGPLSVPGMEQMLREEMGYVPEKGRAYNFDTMGWGFASREGNDLAKNTMPFFSVSRPGGDMRAAADLDKFIAMQSAKIKAALGDTLETQQKINAWKERTVAEAQAAATNSKDALAAERAYIRAVKSSTELRYGSNYFASKPTIGSGSNFKGTMLAPGDYAADREVMPSQPHGVLDSWMVADQKLAVQTQEAVAIMEARNAQMTKDNAKAAIAQQRYNFMIDSLARSMGDDAAALASKIPIDRLSAAMGILTQGIEENSVKFQLMESEGQTYLVALDKATGQLMGVSKQMASGGFRQVPGTSVTSGRVDLATAQKMAYIENQIRADAEARGVIESKMRREASVRNAEEKALLKLEETTRRKELEMQKAGLKITQSDLSAEQKIAALRRAGLINEEQKVVFSKAGLTAEQLSTVEELEQLALEKAQTTVKKQGGLMQKWTASPVASGIAGGAMVAPMAMSMLAPQGSVMSNMANYGMMGSMAGMMVPGPWGMIGGTALGLAVGGLVEAIEAAKRRSDELAAEAAANWEAEFGDVNITDEMADALGLKSLKDPLRIEVFPTSERSAFGSGEAFSQKITESMAAEIKALEEATDSGAALQRAKRLYAELIADGNSPEKVNKIVAEVLRQADQEGAIIDTLAQGQSTREEALKYLKSDIQTRAAAPEAKIREAYYMSSAMTAASYGSGGVGSLSEGAKDNIISAADELGQVYVDKFYNAIERKAASGNYEGVEKAIGKTFEDIANSYVGSYESLTTAAATGVQTPEEILKESGISIIGRSYEDIVKDIASLNDEARNGILDQLSQYPQLQTDIITTNTAMGSFLGTIRESSPEFSALVAKYEEAGYGLQAYQMALDDAKASQIEFNLATAFAGMANKYVNLPEPPEMIDLDQLERQQSREMEMLQESEADKLDALQEAEDARLEAMQDAADKRERLMEKEINQTERQYDKEIGAIEDAEAKRQEAFQNEQERAQRRQEMRNMEISYQEAIANGDLFEAARIRMDIAATKKQREAQSREEKRQEQADNKIAKLEREKNQKLRILNKELRQEQRANEKMIEAAQEASEAKIEAAQEASEARIAAEERANRIELKNARETNREREKYEDQTNQKIAKMWEALLSGNMKDFKDYAKELNINAEDRMKLLIQFQKEKLQDLPLDMYQAFQKAVKSKDWDTLGDLIREGVLGKKSGSWGSGGQVADQGGKSAGGGRGSRTAGMATGGYVSGPGSATSDSIPARLSNGEYVIKASRVQKYGKSFFDKLNEGHNVGVPGKGGYGFAGGGMVQGAVDGVATAIQKSVNMLLGRASATAGGIDQFGGLKGVASGDIVYWDGEPIDQLIAKQLRLAGKIAGSRFTVFQGSYQPQTSYSGTTHTDGGVIDTNGSGVFSPEVVALQKAGFAAWYRGPGAPGAAAAYPAHIHAVSLFSKNLDTNAAYQRDRYLAMSGDGISGPYYGPHVAPIAGLRTKLGLRKGGRINYDNTIANLHKGETVLTKGLTDKFEDRLANVGGNEYNFNVEIGSVNSEVDLERAFEKFVVKHEKRQQTRAGRSRRV